MLQILRTTKKCPVCNKALASPNIDQYPKNFNLIEMVLHLQARTRPLGNSHSLVGLSFGFQVRAPLQKAGQLATHAGAAGCGNRRKGASAVKRSARL